MGVRGDAFDFITTSPPAVIAKVSFSCFKFKHLKLFHVGHHMDWN